MSLPADPQKAFDSLLASLQADLLAWEQAPTVPEDFDPARPWVLTPGGGLTIRTSPPPASVVHLEPGNLVEYSLLPLWGQHLERALGRPWKLVPVTQIRELRIEELTGAIEHLKNLRGRRSRAELERSRAETLESRERDALLEASARAKFSDHLD